MEDRNRNVASSLLALAAIFVCSGAATAGPATLLEVAPLVCDGVFAHKLHLHAAAPTAHPFVAVPPARRPAGLIPLYGAFAALQVADVYSTTQALRRGGVEMNPLMGGVSRSPTGLVAVKLASTATTVAATELLWRNHPRAAVIAMTIITSTYGAVVAHNDRVLRK